MKERDSYIIQSVDPLNDQQKRVIQQVMEHIESIIDTKKVQQWCQFHKGYLVHLFGSRTHGKQRDDSDLDVMIEPEGSNEMDRKQLLVFLHIQHETFQTFLKKEIELDFKYNTSTEDAYYGYTFDYQTQLEENPDFHFHWSDIPSFISISADGIVFDIYEETEELFENDHFRTVK